MTDEKKRRPATAEKQNLASWKFDILETVDNDPSLGKGGACLSVMRAALGLLGHWDARPYLPIIALRKRTGLGQKAAADARSALIKAGYLMRSGQNDRGVDTFTITNPRREVVAALIDARNFKIDSQEKDRKCRQREKRSGVSLKTELTNAGAERDIDNSVSSETSLTVSSIMPLTVSSIIERKDVEGNTVEKNVEGGGAAAPAAISHSAFSVVDLHHLPDEEIITSEAARAAPDDIIDTLSDGMPEAHEAIRRLWACGKLSKKSARAARNVIKLIEDKKREGGKSL